MTLGVCLLTAMANLPAELPHQPVENGDCTNDSSIKEAAIKIIASKVAPVMNQRYGPPCGCKDADAVWEKIDLEMEWNNCSFDGEIQCKYLETQVAGSNGLCGKVTAKRKTSRRNHDTYAFENYIINGKNTINKPYVDGVTIVSSDTDVSGNPTHVWTFAATANDTAAYQNCPCSSTSEWPYKIPAFVDDRYFCDSNGKGELWSGVECESGSRCCQVPHLPPWFCLRNTGTSSNFDTLTIRQIGDAVDISDIELYTAA